MPVSEQRQEQQLYRDTVVLVVIVSVKAETWICGGSLACWIVNLSSLSNLSWTSANTSPETTEGYLNVYDWYGSQLAAQREIDW